MTGILQSNVGFEVHHKTNQGSSGYQTKFYVLQEMLNDIFFVFQAKQDELNEVLAQAQKDVAERDEFVLEMDGNLQVSPSSCFVYVLNVVVANSIFPKHIAALATTLVAGLTCQVSIADFVLRIM